MNMITISGRSIFSGRILELEIDDGIISGMKESDESTSRILSPGFLDIQINGYFGKNYSDSLSQKEIEELVRDIAASGTTQHFPTIITNSEENIHKSIQAIIKARHDSEMLRDAIPGIHIEGPFISPVEGARGVHNPRHIRPASYDEFQRWQEQADGLIRIVTLSPEDENSIDFIRRISEEGIIAAIGHTNAPAEMIERAVDAGARLSTHLGNGCPAYIPRLKNFIWKQLSDSRLAASIISDGFHLPPYVLKSFTSGKGKDKTILISDAAALAGSAPGIYKWGEMDVEIFEDGHMELHNTANLAGASYLLDRCIMHLSEQTSFTLEDSIRCATVNPRELTGIPGWAREPAIGEKANICSFQLINGEISIEKTINGNRELYSKE